MDGTAFLIGVGLFLAGFSLLLLLRNKRNESRRALQPIPVGDPRRAESWDLLTTARGIVKAKGFERHPAQHPDGLLIHFDVGDDLHYATFNPGSLAGKRTLRLRYRCEMSGPAALTPTSPPGWQGPTQLWLFLQREGDSWLASDKDDSEDDRWWSPDCVMPIMPGEHELSADLDDLWTATLRSDSLTNAEGFRDALKHCGRVGFTMGGGDGKGHGCTAREPVGFVILSFEIE